MAFTDLSVFSRDGALTRPLDLRLPATTRPAPPALGHMSANLDLLRALAVLAVMVDHLVPTLCFVGVAVPSWVLQLTRHIGQSGVLAFFVHTSLVLMYSLARLADQGPRLGSLIRRFYVRRAFRIYPLAVVCILAAVAFHLPEATWREPKQLTAEVIAANLLLVQNLVSGTSVLAPLWSLPYEVEMYVVLPFLYVVARSAHGVRWLSALLALCCLGGYGLATVAGHLNMAAYLPCFVSGVLGYALRRTIRRRLPGRIWVLFLLALIGCYALVHWHCLRPVYWIGWCYCLVLALAINFFEDLRSDVLNRLAHQVATYSYGIYLLHVPVLYVVFLAWRPSSVALGIAAFFVLTGVASFVAFHLIEAPMMNLGRRASRASARPGATTAR